MNWSFTFGTYLGFAFPARILYDDHGHKFQPVLQPALGLLARSIGLSSSNQSNPPTLHLRKTSPFRSLCRLTQVYPVRISRSCGGRYGSADRAPRCRRLEWPFTYSEW